jgi:hypothetical protein
MPRSRAETTPTDTEKPWPSGLPMAITQSPTRMLAVAEGHEGQRVIGRHFQQRDVGIGVGADQFGLELDAVERNSIRISSAPSMT